MYPVLPSCQETGASAPLLAWYPTPCWREATLALGGAVHAAEQTSARPGGASKLRPAPRCAKGKRSRKTRSITARIQAPNRARTPQPLPQAPASCLQWPSAGQPTSPAGPGPSFPPGKRPQHATHERRHGREAAGGCASAGGLEEYGRRGSDVPRLGRRHKHCLPARNRPSLGIRVVWRRDSYQRGVLFFVCLSPVERGRRVCVAGSDVRHRALRPRPELRARGWVQPGMGVHGRGARILAHGPQVPLQGPRQVRAPLPRCAGLLPWRDASHRRHGSRFACFDRLATGPLPLRGGGVALTGRVFQRNDCEGEWRFVHAVDKARRRACSDL